jgi:hypothetical protein
MDADEYGSFVVRLWYAHPDGNRQCFGYAEGQQIHSGAWWMFLT